MAYTHDEILAKLQKIRDNSLDWMLQCSEDREGKGTAAAGQLYDRAVIDIEKLEARLGTDQGEPTEVKEQFAQVDPDAAKQWKDLYPDLYDKFYVT